MSIDHQSTPLLFDDTDPGKKTPEVVVDDEAISDQPLSIPEKLKVVRETEGFFPVSKLELSTVQELVGAEEEWGRYAVIRHLQEVKWRQQKPHIKAEDPAAAVRAIVRSYGEFYRRSRYDATMLQQFLAKLEEPLRIDPKQPLSDFIESSGIVTREGPAQFVRYYDLRLIAEQGDIHAAGFDTLAVAAEVSTDPYTNKSTREGLERIAARTSSITTLRAKGALQEVSMAEANRMKYWKSTLMRASLYGIARPIVSEFVALKPDESPEPPF